MFSRLIDKVGSSDKETDMKKRVILFATLVLVFTVEATLATGRQVDIRRSQSSVERRMTAETKQQGETPFACSLTALSAAEREHHRDLGKKLHIAVKETRELPNGYAFRLSGERPTVEMVADWISLERLCCPFFTFQLEIGSEENPIWLRITGREGVKQFMRSEFGIK